MTQEQRLPGSSAERRQPAGVRNLDLILGGGLPPGALVLMMGRPGSGKTTLAHQIAFAAARQGMRALILTTLSESTNKLVEHLRTFSFFDPRLLGQEIQVLSLLPIIKEGLDQAVPEILRRAREMRANLVVLDGFRALERGEGATHEARQFLYALGTSLGTLRIATIITSEISPEDPTFFPETTTADVLLALHYAAGQSTPQRALEVVKVRGAAPLPGMHSITIGPNGVEIFPQMEARVVGEVIARAEMNTPLPSTTGAERMGGPSEVGHNHDITMMPEDSVTTARASFDLPALDKLLGGGLNRSTCTLLAGSSGTGKTLLALHFALAGIQEGEKVLYLGLREELGQILEKADAFALGKQLRAALQPDGGLTFVRLPSVRLNADVVADILLSELERTGAKRLVIDSIFEVERALRASYYPRRVDDYLAALVEEMHRRKITALITRETEKALSATLDFSGEPLSVLAENVLLLQQVAYERELYRVLSVLKMRLSAHDFTLREFHIVAPNGIEVLDPLDSKPGVLEGIARQEGRISQESGMRPPRYKPASKSASKPDGEQRGGELDA